MVRGLRGNASLLPGVALGLLGMRAQVLAERVMAVPLLAVRLDGMDVMGAPPVHVLAEEEAAGKAVLAEVLVAEPRLRGKPRLVALERDKPGGAVVDRSSFLVICDALRETPLNRGVQGRSLT